MSRKNILELGANDAKDFFLKSESYCNIDLPKYFSFSKLLSDISTNFPAETKLQGISNQTIKIQDCEDANYLIYANKDGKLSWRPLQLIHPLAYVDLVHEITSKDNWDKIKRRFKKNSKR